MNISKNGKPVFEIFDWSFRVHIRPWAQCLNVKDPVNQYMKLYGKSRRFGRGLEGIETSKILKIDFDIMEVETMNSIYRLMPWRVEYYEEVEG